MGGRPTTITVLLLAGLGAIVGGVLPPPVFGQCDTNYYWDDGYGSWFAPDNWYHEVWDPDLEECVDDDTIPGGGDQALVWSGNPYISGVGATCDWLDLHSSIDLLPGGSLSARVESIDGCLVQTGGANTLTDEIWLDSSGIYQLSGDAVVNARRIVAGYAGAGTFVQLGGTTTLTQSQDGTSLIIGAEAGGDGSYQLVAGALSAGGIALVGNRGTGRFIQSGGTTVFGQDEYAVSLLIGVEAGSNGLYQQNAGTNTLAGDLLLGSELGSIGTYELSGSSELYARSAIIAYEGTGTFIQNGGMSTLRIGGWGVSLWIGIQPGSDGRYQQSAGTNTLAGDLYVGDNPGSAGSYELSGTGSLSAAGETIGGYGTGTFIQTSGTNTITEWCLTVGSGPGSHGTYELNGDALFTPCEIVGDAGTGIFTHTGGTNTIADFLTLANQGGSSGQYQLSGSSELYARSAIIGYEGTGTFIQNGGMSTLGIGEWGVSLWIGIQPGSDGRYQQSAGTNTLAGDLYVGDNSGSAGRYELSEDGSLSAHSETIGAGGTGTFIQTGGTNTVAENLILGNTAGADGAYDLSAGSLVVMDDVWVGEEGAGSLLIDGPLATLDTPHLLIGFGSGTGSLSIANAAAEIIVGDLTFGANATFSAVPGSSIHVAGARVQNYSTDENALAGLENLNLICDGHYLALEVAGYDGGPFTEYCADNFVIDTLTVNDIVSLWDDVDNGNRGGTYGWNEALYVNNLVFGPDGILYTNGLHVYVNCEPLTGDHGGHVCYGSGCGDFDHDCDADSADFFDFVSCLSGPDVPIGPECDAGDCDADADVDLTDFAAFQTTFTGGN